MSSLVGHALAGIAAAQAASGDPKRRGRRRFWALMAVIAVLPDLDVVVFMLFNPPGMVPHRGASHSLLFAAVIALAVALVFGHFLSLSRLRLFGCAFAAYASHLVLDYLMGKGPQVHFFWPISDHGYLSPVQIVPTAYYGLSGRALEQVLLALKRAGVLTSKRGSSGGYHLTRAPEEITVGAVLRAVEGRDAALEALTRERTTGDGGDLRELWDEIAEAVSKVIDHLTFAELAARARERREAIRPMYHI